jgi:hypothetical protein
MNDRQVEALADRLRDIKTLSALQGGVYPVYLRPDEMDLAEKTLRSRTPSAPRASIVTCCVTGAIPGDGGACGDCDPCILGEASVPEPVKRLIAEKNSLLNRIGELEGRLEEFTPSAPDVAMRDKCKEIALNYDEGRRVYTANGSLVDSRAGLRIADAISRLRIETDPTFDVMGTIDPDFAESFERHNTPPTPAVDREAVARTHKVIVDTHAAITSLPIDALGWASTDDVEWSIRDELADRLDDACADIKAILAIAPPAQEGE